VISATLFAVLIATIVVISPSQVVASESVRHGDAKSLFYITSGAGTGLPNDAEIYAIAVKGIRRLAAQASSAYLCRDLLSWPWPSAAMGLFTQLEQP
jgi:hypothetical protein